MIRAFPLLRSASAGLALLASLVYAEPVRCQNPVYDTLFPPPNIDEERSLFITSTEIVDHDWARNDTDPPGPWSFAGLMSHLAGPVPTGRFVEDWLKTFTTPQTVNGTTVYDASRASQINSVLNNWPEDALGHLDMAHAPFRLLAIVNRPDLLKVADNGVVTSGGEGRFIFGFVEDPYPIPNWTNVKTEKFTVIFEYDLPATSCAEVLAWQRQWASLSGVDPSKPQFHARLRVITDAFTHASPNSTKPNGTLLNQLRSNDLFRQNPRWELREWNLVIGNQGLGVLRNVTAKQTPRFWFIGNGGSGSNVHNRRNILHEYIHLNEPDILDGKHVVPDVFTVNGTSYKFTGGQAINDGDHPTFPDGADPTGANEGGTTWWANPDYDGASDTSSDADARHMFALQTCSGCHQVETGAPFFMVLPRKHGDESVLNGFLTGKTLSDPVNPSIPRSFNDLARRKDVMETILEDGCSNSVTNLPLQIIQSEMGTRVH